MKLTQEKSWILAFFTTALLIGLTAAPRYGVSWDEPNMLNLGTDAWNYVFGSGTWPETAGRRFHGPVIEISLYGVQKLLGLTEPRSIFVMRHILTYGIFLGGLAAFFALAKRIFGNERLALLGTVMLLLSPRIFAHAFYNSRDIPNLVLFTVSMLTLDRTLEQPSKGRILIHALITAAAIAVRTVSILIIPISIVAILSNRSTNQCLPAETLPARAGSPARPVSGWDGAKAGINELTSKQTVLCIVLFFASCAIFTYALWPLLWEAPLRHLKDAILFSGSLQREEYYFGIMQVPPWHYLPIWIAITTPLVYTIFFVWGLLPAIRNRLWIPLLWLFVPLLLVIVLKIGIYDAWRHMYFIYPAFLLIALEGLERLPRKSIAVGILTASFVWTGVWMIRNHPLQDTYFSLPGKLVDDRMERDYWGLSFKEGLLYLLRHDPSPKIIISATSPPGYFAAFTLPKEDQNRIAYSEDNPIYILDNFRASHYEERFPEEKKIHEIKVDGLTVLKIYKVH